MEPTPSKLDQWAFWGHDPEEEIFDHSKAIRLPEVAMSPSKRATKSMSVYFEISLLSR
jgi:hypothetical protein